MTKLPHDLPPLALSVRQPWAFAIIHLGKDVENRSWAALDHLGAYRGRVAIHAAKGMTRAEYEEAAEWIDTYGYCPPCPGASALFRGGIIGSVEIVDYVKHYDSRWFFGPRGLVLRDPRPCPFVPAKGALGFFRWQPADPADVPAPARWMYGQTPQLKATMARLEPEPRLERQAEPDLFSSERE